MSNFASQQTRQAKSEQFQRIPAIDKRLSLVLQLQSANRLSLHTTFIIGIVHALVEQDTLFASSFCLHHARTEVYWHPHMRRKRPGCGQNPTSMFFCARLLSTKRE